MQENEGVVSARWDQTAMEVNEKRSSEDSWVGSCRCMACGLCQLITIVD